MDTIELAATLTIGELAEIFAHKLLHQEQCLCKAIIDEDDIVEADKKPYRESLANSKALAQQAKEACFDQLFHHNLFIEAIDLAIDDHAEEYTRTV